MHKKLVVFAAAFLLLLMGCDPKRVFEQNVDFAKGKWAIDNAPVFTFEIEDTTQAYNIYFNVRYSLQYEFYNLYVRHQLLGPDGKQLSADLHELLLMDAKTGKPLGKGSSDVYDLQTLVLKNVTFDKVGTYKLRLTQYMRRDPLPYVQSVGVRVAKADGSKS
ncbi:gliding motility lipoprotein GldH [Pontibacter liquoris]|uniref:gliding motility lipoprotein GldH n=1 Tax=Pontibacter liquoris TaxID=2905677 RepID=UPI001FA6ABC6|nr:gliding motility lipoprotein GldH [Pontibacter liquoris]